MMFKKEKLKNKIISLAAGLTALLSLTGCAEVSEEVLWMLEQQAAVAEESTVQEAESSLEESIEAQLPGVTIESSDADKTSDENDSLAKTDTDQLQDDSPEVDISEADSAASKDSEDKNQSKYAAEEGKSADQKDNPENQTDKTSDAEDQTADQENADYVEYSFRSKKLLNQHYEKHGIEMGFDSAASYQAAASDVINNPKALTKTEEEDGDFVYYVEDTNEFVILSTDGYIRTYFNPNGGKKYFDRQ